MALITPTAGLLKVYTTYTPASEVLSDTPTLIDADTATTVSTSVGRNSVGIDFGVAKTINQLVVYDNVSVEPSGWYTASGVGLDIYVSADNSTWTFHQNIPAGSVSRTTNVTTLNFTGVSTRYIKFLTDDSASSVLVGASGYPWSITEIEAYGPAIYDDPDSGGGLLASADDRIAHGPNAYSEGDSGAATFASTDDIIAHFWPITYHVDDGGGLLASPDDTVSFVTSPADSGAGLLSSTDEVETVTSTTFAGELRWSLPLVVDGMMDGGAQGELKWFSNFVTWKAGGSITVGQSMSGSLSGSFGKPIMPMVVEGTVGQTVGELRPFKWTVTGDIAIGTTFDGDLGHLTRLAGYVITGDMVNPIVVSGELRPFRWRIQGTGATGMALSGDLKAFRYRGQGILAHGSVMAATLKPFRYRIVGFGYIPQDYAGAISKIASWRVEGDLA